MSFISIHGVVGRYMYVATKRERERERERERTWREWYVSVTPINSCYMYINKHAHST